MGFTNFDLSLKKRSKKSSSFKKKFLSEEELNQALSRLKRFNNLSDQYSDFLDTTRSSNAVVWKEEQILNQAEL